MPKVNALDPQPGMVLLWKGRKVEVIRRLDDLVHYIAHETPPRAGTQSLKDWGTWAGEAKIISCEINTGECIVFSSCVSAACSVCGTWMEYNIHMVDLVFTCGAHCPARKHGFKREKKKEKVCPNGS